MESARVLFGCKASCSNFRLLGIAEETVDESDPSLDASDAESDKEDSWSWDTEDEMDYMEEGPFSLFAYPAEENYAGQKMPLEWIERVKAKTKAYKGGQKTNWKVSAPTLPLLYNSPHPSSGRRLWYQKEDA